MAQGGVLYRNGADEIAQTAAGTSGQVLTSNGASTNPTFQNPAGTGNVSTGVTLTAGVTVVGAGSTSVALSSLTATVVKSASGTLSAATAGTDYTALAFKTISVSGQSDVVADSAADTLTLAGGTGVTITTDASTDTVTIAASGASAFWTDVVAASDQDIDSNTTPATDAELFFTMTAAKIYEFELHLIYNSPAGGTTPDLKFNFAGPATFTGQYSITLYVGTADSLTGALAQAAPATTSAIGTATTPRLAFCRGWAYSTAGGSGSSGFQFQWSQNTSGANPTRRLAGSVLRYRQLSV